MTDLAHEAYFTLASDQPAAALEDLLDTTTLIERYGPRFGGARIVAAAKWAVHHGVMLREMGGWQLLVAPDVTEVLVAVGRAVGDESSGGSAGVPGPAMTLDAALTQCSALSLWRHGIVVLAGRDITLDSRGFGVDSQRRVIMADVPETSDAGHIDPSMPRT